MGNTTEQRATSGPRPGRRRLFAGLGALVAVAGLAVPVHYFATQRASSVQTLQNPETLAPSAAPREAEEVVLAAGEDMLAAVPAYKDIVGEAADQTFNNMVWSLEGGSVPIDAPLSEFPVTGDVDEDLWGCSTEQLDWLNSYGIPNPLRGGLDDEVYILISETLHNTATSGGALSLRNLRVEGDFTDQTTPRVRFACMSGGSGDVGPPIFAKATIGDSAPAVFVENSGAEEFYSPDELVPADLIGTPVTANLEPGEQVQFYLFLDSLDPTRDFVGRIVTDVVVGEDVYEYVIREGYLQTSEPRVETVFAIAAFGTILCLPDADTFSDVWQAASYEVAISYQCTPAELSALAGAV